ncbi:carbohydrate ABC transporter permease [Glycomyces xiaoerkulensis]|uniref:carbohydrate ABC transporter permease n=1 Tax=Glycomyces xiaoerkulensis TaxID=2038139 RepID=UPI000C260A97|nr:carbohydrate ABC transporter permease [Glycomyces xiaoerkulensis]
MTAITTPRRNGSRRRAAWDEEPSPFAKFTKAAFLTAYAAAVIIPIWTIIVTSLSTEDALTDAGGNMVFLPTDLSLQAYKVVLGGGEFTSSLLYTAQITAIGTAVSMVITIGAAYGLSRPGTLFHRPLLMLILLTFLFQPGIVPSFLVVKNLGLLNTFWALILPMSFNAFNLIVLRAFFMNSVPRELIDAARIDGAGEFRTLFRIVLPMSKAILAVIALFYAVFYWNIYFQAVLLTPSLDEQPIQVLLQRAILTTTGLPGQDAAMADLRAAGQEVAPDTSIKMAVVICTILPIVIMYPFIQKHFSKAVITGAVKG